MSCVPPCGSASREHMIPVAFVHLLSLPQTPTGKVDRRALPQGSAMVVEKTSSVAPRTGTETRLAALWQTLLGVESVGVRDGFFDLGGHSLLAVRLFAAIDKEFGKRLPMSTILEGDTIEHVAQVIDGVVAPSIWPSLVPLQAGGSRPPFFCIHTINGDVVSYLALASHVGPDQPFYAVRARGLDGLQEPHRSVEAAAADYIREIKQVQPQGPYCLGGFSCGATIAFEMAQQLQARGDEIGLLAIFDSPPARTRYYERPRGIRFCVCWVRALPRRLGRFVRKTRADKFDAIRRKRHKLFRRPGTVQEECTKSPGDRAGVFASRLGKYLFGD